MKKIILIGVMAGMTASAASTSNWQYRRYKDSVFRWDKIFS